MPKIWLWGSIGIKERSNGGANDPKIWIMDMKNFLVFFIQNPQENGSDDAPEDALMENVNVDVYLQFWRLGSNATSTWIFQNWTT